MTSLRAVQTIPILRIFSLEKAKAFCVGYLRPGVERTFYGCKCVEVIDPFSNRIRFDESLEEKKGA